MTKLSGPRALVGASVALAAAALAASALSFTAWSVAASPSPSTYGNLFKAVAAISATDAWAVGGGATATSNVPFAAHWNGTAWSAMPTPSPSGACQDGNFQWTGNTLNAVAATSRTDVWAVGHRCYTAATLVEHWNGTAWSIVPSPSFTTGADGVQNSLNGVVGLSPANAWAVGMHTAANGAFVTLVERWNGSTWSVVASPSPSATANVLDAAAASGPSDVWAVGWQNTPTIKPLIEHWNGSSAWSVVAAPAVSGTSQLLAVTAVSAADAWAVGYQTNAAGARVTLALHWNGTAWTAVSTPNQATSYGSENILRGVTAVSSTSVWAAGMAQSASTAHQHRAMTLRWNGTSWSAVSTPTPGQSGELNAVAADRTSGRLFSSGLWSKNQINIYDGTYFAPQTLALNG